MSATANRPACPNCGRQLNAFGICPGASPSDAANAPIGQVYCVPAGLKEHPEGCDCGRCRFTREILFA